MDKKTGYNEKWETVSWKESRAYRERRDKEKEFLPFIRSNAQFEDKQKTKGTEDEDTSFTCHILKYLSNLPSNLPLISSFINPQGKPMEEGKIKRALKVEPSWTQEPVETLYLLILLNL